MSEANEPVFPITAIINGDIEKQVKVIMQSGPTKRELFAVVMLHGMLTNPEFNDTHEELSKGACRFADALLAELERTK